MGFKEARKTFIIALKEGRYSHEVRDVLAEKNLLAIGDIDADLVIRLLRRTRGDQYEATPHHWDRAVTVHLFRPIHQGERWYVKAYFVEDSPGDAVFISVHR